MATDKKSFLVYCDWIHTVEKLPNEIAGELFKHLLEYVNDRNPVTENLIVDVTFEPMKQQLKRDLKKWEKISERNRENGNKGGRPITQKNPKEPSGLIDNPKEPDTVTVTVNETVKDIKNTFNIESRKLAFSKQLNPFLDKYGKPLLKDFLEYWCEHNENGKKMRFEMSKNQPFNISRRLSTWNKTNKNGNTGHSKANSTSGAGTTRQDFP